ncbi:MAG: hypothetical protein LBJ88_06630 [Campylobacteraceae bacterium]|jgi:hypothetical protein|nr:hypothetical protein [Campylobacteraceae bacterium]
MLFFKLKTMIKFIWLTFAIAVFIHYVYLTILVEYYDYDFYMLIASFMQNAMATNILAFPMTAIVGFIIAITTDIMTAIMPSLSPLPVGGVIFKAIALILGYIQWFIIVPWILRTPIKK